MASLFEMMRPGDMTDGGMWIWAGLLAAVGLAASYFIALAWQRWKDGRKA